MNKELREYVEELSKTKAAKVEPEQIGGPEQELSETVAWGSFAVGAVFRGLGILGSLGMALSEAPEPAEPGEPGEPVQPGQPDQPESEERPETSKDNYIKEDRVVSQARAHRMTGTGGAGLGRFAIC